MGLTNILADDIICSGHIVKGHLQHAHQQRACQGLVRDSPILNKLSTIAILLSGTAKAIPMSAELPTQKLGEILWIP